MRVIMNLVTSAIRTKSWWVISAVLMMTAVEVTGLNGPNVCMVQQKYNITKRVKYRAPVSVRSYVWCLAVPPRCSQWKTEMRDLTRLETEERTAEMAVCCPGYKMRDVSCVPICPSGKTGHGCSEDCPPMKWGPNCVHECKKCAHGRCSPTTGRCLCHEGWRGESCEISMATTPVVDVLTTTKAPKFITITTPLYIPTETARSTTETTTKAMTSIIKSTAVANIQNATIAVSTPSTTPKTTIYDTTQSSPKTTTIKENEAASQETGEKVPSYNNVTLAQKNSLDVFTTDVTKDFYVPNENSPSTMTTITKALGTTNILDSEVISTSTLKPTINTSFESTHLTTILDSAKTTYAIKETTNQPAITVKEISKKPEHIVIKSTTTKLKPKEIWIKTAQKGDSLIIETKIKQTLDKPKVRSPPKKESSAEVTTPKTIIVSIIPTSVTYVTFRKLSLTTASSSSKSPVSVRSYSSTNDSMDDTQLVAQDAVTRPIKIIGSKRTFATSTLIPALENVTKTKGAASIVPQTTNSMLSTFASMNKPLNSSNILTTVSFPSINVAPSRKPNSRSIMTTKTSTPRLEKAETMSNKDTSLQVKTTTNKQFDTNETKRNDTNTKTNPVTDDPNKGEETFHILTEPEHITAVMGDKRNERTSVDLISVISIAGGVMMAIITVAVVIVMLERCKKPRYEDVGKFNDITMQVMIDNNDVPPPYVRSIFHTPLPGILECHYDHLPQRTHAFEIGNAHSSEAPPADESQELLSQRVDSVTESTIEALKCEAKFDVIDNTTSEPLYAEIPCWRPPSEHAVEINNLNGEAVTEL